ncbi:MAG: hypothetical protein WCS59_07045 [Sphaerochaetaceae bacterium]|jgi:hypothetical protein|nr:hypothetical protein [Sphaerochaetaceae bacterium]MDD4219315.1 hypothetical protein [Sphaerochaetaceae bacterium]MDY0371130.1 hypothetical protein [Sphaerochaetaceae bacterium]
MKKTTLQIIAKVALLLVIFGFFMPVACGRTGFELTKTMGDLGAEGSAFSVASFLLILMFISAIVGVALLLVKRAILLLDWIVLLTGIGSGVLAYLMVRGKGAIVRSIVDGSLDVGAYFIITGWAISAVALTVASLLNPRE